jgi:cysteine desulfurase
VSKAIYLDNNATTQLAPTVLDSMYAALDTFGNPSSAHSVGKRSRTIVEDARESVAAFIGAEHSNEIVFTSGGTESDNWAILGSLAARPDKNHIITTRVEHEAVRKLCERLVTLGTRVTLLDVDHSGCLDLDQLRTSVGQDAAVVSVMMANNETGVVFPVEEIAEIVKERSEALFHVDGVNAAGKISIDLKRTRIDLFSLSAHKFHGPKGIGA